MERIIIAEKNAIKIEIKEMEGWIKIGENTIKRLRCAKNNVEFNRAKILKTKADIDMFNEKMSTLKQRLIQADRGELNEELKTRMKKDTKIQKEKNMKKLKAKQDKINDTKEKNEDLKKHIYSLRMGRRQERWGVKNANRGYQYFVRVVSSIPQYMLAKLDNMPNNKGYWWRGVILYGKKNRERNKPTVIFERKKGIQYIHEWSENLMVEKIFIKDDDFQWLRRKKTFEESKGTQIRKLVSDETFEKPEKRPRSYQRKNNRRNHFNNGVSRNNRSNSNSRNSNRTPSDKGTSSAKGRSHHKDGNGLSKTALANRRSRSRKPPTTQSKYRRYPKNNGGGKQPCKETSTYRGKGTSSRRGRGRRRGRGSKNRPKFENTNTSGQGVNGTAHKHAAWGRGRGRGRHLTKPAWMTKK